MLSWGSMTQREPKWALRAIYGAAWGGALMGWACSSAPRAQVIDLGSERYESTAVSSYERDAHNEAFEAAIQHCARQGKRVEVVREISRFRGMDREARAGLAMAGALLGNMVGGYRGGNASTQVRGTSAKEEDYRYILHFTCTDRGPIPTPKESFFDSF
jgi:hypothetical protein